MRELEKIDAVARLACDRLVELDRAGMLDGLDENALHWVRLYGERAEAWKARNLTYVRSDRWLPQEAFEDLKDVPCGGCGALIARPHTPHLPNCPFTDELAVPADGAQEINGLLER